MKDFGYDVSDYCAVDPMFGDMADFKNLVARAHALGLRVMIDQVLSHTSDQHAWFQASRASRDNAHSDWYVWADPKDDGSPPNNWLSIFGGSAWTWDTRRCQYYLHNFLSSQPDLNFHHAPVRQALLDSVQFWLDCGVDGYRLDTANFYYHDAQLRNNPARGVPDPSKPDPAVNAYNPYAWQWHRYDKSQPENLAFLQDLRALLDRYPNTTMVGEIGDDDGLARVAQYTQGGDKLHMAYCFDLLSAEHSASFLHGVLTRFGAVVGDGWPCWATSNHDVTRVATRWAAGAAQADPCQLRLSMALLLSLRGSVCLYQGEELGLPEAELDFADLQDPYGITMWPEYKGRDGCRTPMPWQADVPHAGFSTATKTWLPVAATHLPLAVDQQTQDSHSMLHFVQSFLRWRKTHAALVQGSLTLHPLQGDDARVLAFTRSMPDAAQGSITCLFNCSSVTAQYPLPKRAGAVATVLSDHPLAPSASLQSHHGAWQVELAPWGGRISKTPKDREYPAICPTLILIACASSMQAPPMRRFKTPI